MTEQATPLRPGMDVVVDFGRPEWTQAADESTFPPVKRHRLTARRSRVMETLGAVHASDGAALAALVDLAVLAMVSLFLDVVPTWFRIAYPVAAVAAGYVGRLYTERDSVQTRGVGWYPGRVVGALTAVAVIPVALGLVGVAAAAELEIGAFVALTGLRCLTWVALVVARRRGHSLRPTLIIGAAQPAATVWRRLVEFPEAGLLPVQLLTFDAAHEPGVVQDALDEWDIQHVVLVAPGRAEAALTASLPRQPERAPFFSAVPALTELFLDPGSVTEVGGIPLIPLGRVTRMRHRFPGKRAFDIAVSSLLLLLGAPLLALVAIAVKLDDGGPIFYRQARVGRNGELFRMVKFRTMVVGADKLLDEML
ncbi:MAG: sugar transferase, partial [Frankiales bacterium]|nr:sugar transferase [Frankiales bacterium]